MSIIKQRFTISCILAFALCIVVKGQPELVLKHNFKEGKIKKMSLDSYYDIFTSNDKYIGHKISEFNDTSITIYQYSSDAKVTIALNEITKIREHWFKNEGAGTELIAWTAGLATLGFILAPPLVLITSGSAAALEVLVVTGVITGISWSALFIISRKSKYDLVEKWTIIIDED